MATSTETLIKEIVRNGRFYAETQVHDCESGPYATRSSGLRWGQLHLIYNASGRTYLARLRKHDYLMWGPVTLSCWLRATLDIVACYGNDEAMWQTVKKDVLVTLGAEGLYPQGEL